MKALSKHVIELRPSQANLALELILLWTDVEIEFGRIVSVMSDSPRALNAIYELGWQSSRKQAAVLAIAKACLLREEFALLEIAFDFIKPVGEARNRLSHWQWSYDHSKPDAVFLINPRRDLAYNVFRSELDIRNRSAEHRAYIAEKLPREIERKYIDKFDTRRLELLISRAGRALELLILIRGHLIDARDFPDWRDQSLLKLFDLPEFRRKPPKIPAKD